MTGESELLAMLLARLDALEASANQDLALLGALPNEVEAFTALEPIRQTASRGVLKCFEQIEDQLARAFRLLPRLLGSDVDGWYMLDYAEFMAKANVIDDVDAWMAAVKLRNRLVHDYPIEPAAQLERLQAVVAAIPFLIAVRQRLAAFVASRSEFS